MKVISLGLGVQSKEVSEPEFVKKMVLDKSEVNGNYINQLIARGMDGLEAVIEGAVVRMRPILITALSTICGMLPMAMATAEGSEMRSPMAITIIGGLMASTFLTLFIVPILYTYFSKIKIRK